MIQGTIENIAFGGHGVLRTDAHGVVFVPFAAPGDHLTVEITKKKKSHAFGQIIQIDQPSPQRIEASCPLFGSCGGCQLQHLSYETQLEVKRRFVEESLQRIGGLSVCVPPVVPATMQWAYRRHIRLNIRKKEEGFEAGYIGCDKTFLRVEECPLFQGPNLQEVQELLGKLSNEGIKEASLRLFHPSLLALSFFPHLPHNRKDVMAEQKQARVVMQAPRQKEHYGNTNAFVEVQGLRFQYSPFGFLQNHAEQSEKLYLAIEPPPQSKRVLDLYCGIGITSLLLAEKGLEVLGIETHPEAVKLAKHNAHLNQVSSVSFIEGKAEEAIQGALQDFKPDCVLMNPPREGLAPPVMEALRHSKPDALIYISCMPSTLARDLRLFKEAGYEIEKIQAFDMFPQTTHVETLVHIKKL
jgi:23S rRNA (uracil1939-C5)-methyltransferase